jgi:hypothetical protein
MIKLFWIDADDRHDPNIVAYAWREDLQDHWVAKIVFVQDEDGYKDFDKYVLEIVKVTKEIKWEDRAKKTVLSVSDPIQCYKPGGGDFKTEEEARKEAEDQIAILYEAERPGYEYRFDGFYGYQPMDHDKDGNVTCWYIEGKDGEMLIGDRLPSTEEEAIQYCRIANIAYRHGLEKGKSK